MKKWEYKVVWLSTRDSYKQEKLLDDLGCDGWELVAVVEGIIFYLKREKTI
jgi:hypothetical protein